MAITTVSKTVILGSSPSAPVSLFTLFLLIKKSYLKRRFEPFRYY